MKCGRAAAFFVFAFFLSGAVHDGLALQVKGKKQNTVQPVRIGVASMITPVDTVKYFQEIIDYIGEQIGQPVQMVHRRTYEEMDTMLERGEVNVAFICSASYVMDHDKFGVELLAAPVVNGRPSYHSYIIVHKDSPVKSFSELKGSVFAFTDPRSNSGKWYPEYLLKTMGLTPENFFRKHIYSYSHNKSVEMVGKRIADAAAVDSLVYEYMVKKNSPYAKQAKIIKRSPSYGIPPVVATKNIDPILKEKIRQAFFGMHNSDKGRQILSAMMIDRFTGITDREYDSIRHMELAIAGNTFHAVKRPAENIIYFGVIPRDNPRILYEKYQPLLDYLAENTPYRYELVLKKNYEETVKALGEGETQIAMLGPLTYLEARAKYRAVSILKPRGVNNDSTFRSVIITKEGSGVKDITDSMGRSFAFSASRSTSGNLIPRYMLASSGIHLNELSFYANFDFHDSVVKAVLRGQYEIGAVRESVAKKYMKLGIKKVAESEPIPTGPIVAGPGVSPDVITNIKKALLDLKPGGSIHDKVLKRLDEEYRNGFIEATDMDYAAIREKINAVPKTCGMGCHPKIRL